MVKRIAITAGVIVVATILAAMSAWWMTFKSPIRQTIANGAWRTSLTTGSADADMYTRAIVAVTGLFALSAAEAIYFAATVDDDGQPLRARCSYAIAGRPVAARWWSITAYGDDHFLIPNSIDRFSFNMGNLPVDGEGRFGIVAAPAGQGAHWLPTGSGSGGFNLLFRIYNPAPETIANLRTIALPSIKRSGTC